MFKFLRERKKDNKGFTLVELVIVIAILAILVGILAPQYTKYVEKSRKSADATNMDELVKAVQVYAVDNAIVKKTNEIKVTIQLTKDGVKGADTANGGTTTTTPGNLKATDIATEAFEAYVPNWKNIKLKSEQWGGNPTVELTIDAEGGVKTTNVAPDDFKKFYGGVDTTVDTTTNTNP